MAPVRFRRPRRSREQEAADTDRLIFPPTVYTDANYTKGILIPDARLNHDNHGDSNDNGETAHGESITEEVVVEIPENYFRLDDDNDTQDRNNDNLLQLQPVLSHFQLPTGCCKNQRLPSSEDFLLHQWQLCDHEGLLQSPLCLLTYLCI